MGKRLRRYMPIVIPIVAVLLIVALLVWFFNRQIDPVTLAKNRDMAIILSSLILAFGMFLFSVMVGIVIWLLLLVKDKVIPTLDSINATVQRVKETTDVVAENVVDTSQRVKSRPSSTSSGLTREGKRDSQ